MPLSLAVAAKVAVCRRPVKHWPTDSCLPADRWSSAYSIWKCLVPPTACRAVSGFCIDLRACSGDSSWNGRVPEKNTLTQKLLVEMVSRSWPSQPNGARMEPGFRELEPEPVPRMSLALPFSSAEVEAEATCRWQPLETRSSPIRRLLAQLPRFAVPAAQ